jgi:hypothetical protein
MQGKDPAGSEIGTLRGRADGRISIAIRAQAQTQEYDEHYTGPFKVRASWHGWKMIGVKMDVWNGICAFRWRLSLLDSSLRLPSQPAHVVHSIARVERKRPWRPALRRLHSLLRPAAEPTN